jgi:hypothetical protein
MKCNELLALLLERLLEQSDNDAAPTVATIADASATEESCCVLNSA